MARPGGVTERVLVEDGQRRVERRGCAVVGGPQGFGGLGAGLRVVFPGCGAGGERAALIDWHARTVDQLDGNLNTVG